MGLYFLHLLLLTVGGLYDMVYKTFWCHQIICVMKLVLQQICMETFTGWKQQEHVDFLNDECWSKHCTFPHSALVISLVHSPSITQFRYVWCAHRSAGVQRIVWCWIALMINCSVVDCIQPIVIEPCQPTLMSFQICWWTFCHLTSSHWHIIHCHARSKFSDGSFS